MKAMHDILWPKQVKNWHYWTERRFRAHCEGWTYISYAGGASTAKSYDAAKIAILFWLGYMKQRSVIVASTSLASLESRIWGYISNLMQEIKLSLPYQAFSSKPPSIIYDDPHKNRKKDLKDKIHGMFAIAAKRGDDETAISNWIGRHPKNGLLVVLDEGTDMPPALLNVTPNLSANMRDQGKLFQCMIIGNSKSKFDLHGAMSTPKAGWDTVDPMKDLTWETTQSNGICLFFNCYESPAIHETDPDLRKRLGAFLATEDEIQEKALQLGEDSNGFWRFVIGYWQSTTLDDTVMSEQFLKGFGASRKVEWAGTHDLVTVGGLDVAFSTGGDSCILRLAVLGVDASGNRVLDYMGDDLLFYVPIMANDPRAAEIQIADFVLPILRKYRCQLRDLTIDATGQGRAVGSVLQLKNHDPLQVPIKIYSTRTGSGTKNAHDVVIMTAHDLWFSMRPFVERGQIFGLDNKAVIQFTQRQVVPTKNSSRLLLETKKEFKTRMGAVNPKLARSPDEADACALTLQGAIRNYGFVPGQRYKNFGSSTTAFDHKMAIHQRNMELQTQQHQQRKHARPPSATFNNTNLHASPIKLKR